MKAFAQENLLVLHVCKFDILLFSRDQNIIPLTYVVEGTVIPAGDEGLLLPLRLGYEVT